MSEYIAPGNITYKGVSNPLLEIKEKLLLLNNTDISVDGEVSVGVPGDAYATIQEAIDAGRYNIVVSSSTTVTEDVVMPGKISVSIRLMPDVLLTMQDAVFSGPTAYLTLRGVKMRLQQTNTPKLVMAYTSMPASRAFDLLELTLEDIYVHLESPSVADVPYITIPTLVQIFNSAVLTRLSGTGVPAMQMGRNSSIIQSQIGDLSSVLCDVLSMHAPALIRDSYLSSLFGMGGVTRLFFPGGGIGVAENTRFLRLELGTQTDSIFSGCQMDECTLTTTIGGTDYAGIRTQFNSCIFNFSPGNIVITGTGNIFSSCIITLPDAIGFDLQAEGTSLVNCNIRLDTGKVLVSANKVIVMGCYATVSNFLLETSVGTSDVKIIGNTFSGALVDGGAPNNQVLGNSP